LDTDKKYQIIKAAQKRFVKHGLNKTTLDEIARDLRMGKASLYYYFKSKEDLFYQTIDWETSLMLEEINGIFINTEKDLRSRIKAYLTLKEECSTKYKLVYELLVLFISDRALEHELIYVTNLLNGEVKVLSAALMLMKKEKGKSFSDVEIYFIVLNSWGIALLKSLHNVYGAEAAEKQKEMLLDTFEEILTKVIA
jgi:AcrR family transcriptional regulator